MRCLEPRGACLAVAVLLAGLFRRFPTAALSRFHPYPTRVATRSRWGDAVEAEEEDYDQELPANQVRWACD